MEWCVSKVNIRKQSSSKIRQGTVLEPPLWNVYFSDVSTVTEGNEHVFADDLNIFRKFDLTKTNSEILTIMQQNRDMVYEWGSSNQVSFESSKEK